VEEAKEYRMSEEVSLDFELTKNNKKAMEELLKASGVRHYILETTFGTIDVIEYKEYLKLKEVLNKIKETINYYAIENEDYSKIYNQEEQDILKLLEEIE
jgi:hypothetical protein